MRLLAVVRRQSALYELPTRSEQPLSEHLHRGGTLVSAAATAVNQLIERGLLDPDAPIAEYWPEFAANGKGHIPLRWALSHRAGLAAVDGDLTLDDVAAWDPVVEAIAAQAPNWEPGTKHGYHARSYGWIAGEVIQRVTGLMPGEYIANEIVVPLDLDLFVGTTPDQDARIASLRNSGAKGGRARFAFWLCSCSTASLRAYKSAAPVA